MSTGMVAILLIFGTGFVSVAGGIFLKALRILKEDSSRQNKQLQADEAKLIQEIYQGILRMEERVEALETILLDRERRKEGYK
ncbi:MAG: phage-shock protein [Candidatus Tectomicrobia bacterium]|nr:phage-shock protein [Candidatus Tectomicrobia bacterium]